MAGVKGKSGRKPNALALEFRQFCRDTINKPEVLKAISERAESDPVFALRVAEFGIGRPFQSVHVTDDRQDGIYRSEFADGQPVHTPTASDLPN